MRKYGLVKTLFQEQGFYFMIYFTFNYAFTLPLTFATTSSAILLGAGA